MGDLMRKLIHEPLAAQRDEIQMQIKYRIHVVLTSCKVNKVNIKVRKIIGIVCSVPNSVKLIHRPSTSINMHHPYSYTSPALRVLGEHMETLHEHAKSSLKGFRLRSQAYDLLAISQKVVGFFLKKKTLRGVPFPFMCSSICLYRPLEQTKM